MGVTDLTDLVNELQDSWIAGVVKRRDVAIAAVNCQRVLYEVIGADADKIDFSHKSFDLHGRGLVLAMPVEG